MSAPSKQHETGRKIDRLFAVHVKHTNSERSATPLRLPEQRLLRARGSLDKGETSRSVGCDQALFPMATEAQRSRQYHDSVVTIYG